MDNCIQVKAVFLTVKLFAVCIRDKVLAQRLSSQGLSYPSFLQPPWDMCEREHLSKTTCFNSHTSYTLCTIDSSSEFQKSFEERKRPYFHSSVEYVKIGQKGVLSCTYFGSTIILRDVLKEAKNLVFRVSHFR